MFIKEISVVNTASLEQTVLNLSIVLSKKEIDDIDIRGIMFTNHLRVDDAKTLLNIISLMREYDIGVDRLKDYVASGITADTLVEE